MAIEAHKYGYGPNKAQTLDSMEDVIARHVLTGLISPEITRGMRLPNTHNIDGWWIEVPKLPDNQYFLRIIRNLIDEAEKSLHHEILIQAIAVRFVPDIYLKDRASGKVREMSGQTLSFGLTKVEALSPLFVEVSLSALKGKCTIQKRHWMYFAIRTIFHEIFEVDYNVRMQLGQIPKSSKVSEFDSNYANAPHEQYATNKAEQLVQTVFIDAPMDLRQIALGWVGEKQIKVQTTAVNQLASAMLRFLAENG